jgi:cytochrome P450
MPPKKDAAVRKNFSNLEKDSQIPETRLPPGKMGLPWIGETLAFAANGFAFVDDRVARFGPVFKTRLLGRDTVVLSGAQGCQTFLDPELCLRGRPLPNIRALFGGFSLPMLDGKEHLARKTAVLEGFTRPLLQAYLPAMQTMIEASVARWAERRELDLLDELKRLAMEVIFTNVVSVGPGPKLDAVRADYRTLQQAFGALPLRLPGTAFSRALAARDRILDFYAEQIARHRRESLSDGLSHILNAHGPQGEPITDEQAKLELHHIIVAGFIIFCEFADSLMHLEGAPNVKLRLSEEVRRAPRGPFSLEQLDKMTYLTQVVMEVKRLCQILPVIFGCARKTFTVQGYTVPEGWMLLWGLRSTHLDPAVYRDPRRFDPDRFSKERAEHRSHEFAFVPHGGGPATGHKCPGTDYATYFMKAFLVSFLRHYDWRLSSSKMEYGYRITPPEPKGGLSAKVWRT